MYSRSVAVLSAALAATIVLGLAFMRWNGPEISRPLECDELTTLEYYTWAGLAANGETHRLRRVDDYRNLPRVKFLQLGMGIYRGFGVWTDTNNHVLHSLLINFAIAAGNPDERTVRMPALLGAIVASFLAFWVCRQVLGWRAAAPFAAVTIFCMPYMVQYSQEARGYTWMVVLMFLQISLMYRLARRPDSIVWGAVCAVLAILTFMNLVTMALDWLLPLYLAFWIFPPLPTGSEAVSSEKVRAWRRNLLVQMLAFGTVGLVFLMDRLPAVYSTMYQHGDPFSGVVHYSYLLAVRLEYLFPGLVWELIAILGLTGIVAMLFTRSDRPLGAAAMFTLGISLSHPFLAGKFPPERTFGYLEPLAVIGTAYIVERSLALIRSSRWQLALYGGLTASTVGLVLLSLKYPVRFDERMVELARLISEQEDLTRNPCYAVLPPGAGSDPMRLLFPNVWIDPGDRLPDHGEVNLVYYLPHKAEQRLLMEEGFHDRWNRRPQDHNLKRSSMPTIPAFGGLWWTWRQLYHPLKHQTPPGNYCRLAWQRMRINLLTAETDVHLAFPTLIVWKPAADRLGLDGSAVREHIARFQLLYLQRNIREPAKLSHFGRLNALEFLPQSTAEAETTMAMLKEGLKRFGGSAWLFQPITESGE